jgi:hypothetical protein
MSDTKNLSPERAVNQSRFSPLAAIAQLARFIQDKKEKALEARQKRTHVVLQAVLDLTERRAISIPGRERTILTGAFGPLDIDSPAILRISDGKVCILKSYESGIHLHPNGTIGSRGADIVDGHYRGTHFVPSAQFLADASACYDKGGAALQDFISSLAATRQPITDLEKRVVDMQVRLQPGRYDTSVQGQGLQKAINAGVANGTGPAAVANFMDHMQVAMYEHAKSIEAFQDEMKKFDAYYSFDMARFAEIGAAKEFSALVDKISVADIELLERKANAADVLRDSALGLGGTRLDRDGVDKVKYSVFSAMRSVDPQFAQSAKIVSAIQKDLTAFCEEHKSTQAALGRGIANREWLSGYERTMLLLSIENRIFATVKGLDLSDQTISAEVTPGV